MDTEEYLLMILSDGNLPTGAFVASAGLESYIKHGHPPGGSATNPTTTINFMRDSLQNYARSALPFARDAHRLAELHKSQSELSSESTIKSISELDDLYDKMTLNHVARRASKTQGVALLTLYSRGFTRPAYLDSMNVDPEKSRIGALIDTLKLSVRKGEIHGHLPICWGILTASLDLSAERSIEVHLFLYARSVLSSAIRLNSLGPYSAQQLLLHVVKPLVREECSTQTRITLDVNDDEWEGPANTWPLGEILGARHDQQHSRIFNS
ncbi:urease accessory protein UreF [Ceratobasidium sp. AG-Ba]|nr:urease accessory protein UreF [Ceratobasidium sp. AG-Ba]QRW01931.1 urease accessory protein UreF [Ceratobasidium sp. AG-Ba]